MANLKMEVSYTPEGAEGEEDGSVVRLEEIGDDVDVEKEEALKKLKERMKVELGLPKELNEEKERLLQQAVIFRYDRELIGKYWLNTMDQLTSASADALEKSRESVAIRRKMDEDRKKSEKAWMNYDKLKIYSSSVKEGQMQRYLNQHKFEDASNKIKLETDEEVKKLMAKRSELAKELERVQTMQRNSEAHHQKEIAALKGIFESLLTISGTAAGSSSSGKKKKKSKAVMKKILADVLKEVGTDGLGQKPGEDVSQIVSDLLDDSSSQGAGASADTWPYSEEVAQDCLKELGLGDTPALKLPNPYVLLRKKDPKSNIYS